MFPEKYTNNHYEDFLRQGLTFPNQPQQFEEMVVSQQEFIQVPVINHCPNQDYHLPHEIPNNVKGVVIKDARHRLRWTEELHEQFVQAVNQLGGPFSQ